MAPQITGASTQKSGTAYINITALLCIKLDDNSIDFGGGAVFDNSTCAELYSNSTPVYNGSWNTINDPFELRNCGNTYLNVTIKINNASFMGGTGGKTWYMGQDDVSPGEAGSCVTWGVTESIWNEFTADDTAFALCNNLSFGNSADELRIDLRLRIPSDAPEEAKNATITFSSVEA